MDLRGQVGQKQLVDKYVTHEHEAMIFVLIRLPLSIALIRSWRWVLIHTRVYGISQIAFLHLPFVKLHQYMNKVNNIRGIGPLSRREQHLRGSKVCQDLSLYNSPAALSLCRFTIHDLSCMRGPTSSILICRLTFGVRKLLQLLRWNSLLRVQIHLCGCS